MRRALAVAVAFAALAPAAQARNPITGTLDKPGFTVVAMARDGRVTLSTAKANGDFRIVPPASRVTLHLRTKAGQYGGPVIIAGAGKSLVMGVHHGVDLGAVHVAHGFARVKKAPAKAKQDTSFKARARSPTRRRPPRRAPRATR